MSGEKLFTGQVVMVRYEGVWSGPFVIKRIQKRWFDNSEPNVMDGYKNREPKKSHDYSYAPLISFEFGREFDASFVFSMKDWKKIVTKEINAVQRKAENMEAK